MLLYFQTILKQENDLKEIKIKRYLLTLQHYYIPLIKIPSQVYRYSKPTKATISLEI